MNFSLRLWNAKRKKFQGLSVLMSWHNYRMGAAKKEIKFIYDSKGNRTDVVIPLESYANQLEDFFDIQAVEKQKNEKRITLEEIENRFKKKHG